MMIYVIQEIFTQWHSITSQNYFPNGTALHPRTTHLLMEHYIPGLLAHWHRVTLQNCLFSDKASLPRTMHPMTVSHPRTVHPVTASHPRIMHPMTLSHPKTMHPMTQCHIPELCTQWHNVTSQNYLPSSTMSHHRRFEFPEALLWGPQTLWWLCVKTCYETLD